MQEITGGRVEGPGTSAPSWSQRRSRGSSLCGQTSLSEK